MEKFTVDLDKVLDEFEFNEGNFILMIWLSLFILSYYIQLNNYYFNTEREQLQASILNGQSNIIPETQVII